MNNIPSDNQVKEITNPPTQTSASRIDQKLAAYERRKIEHLADEINKLKPEERTKVLKDLRVTFNETASENDRFLIEKMSSRAFVGYNTHNSRVGPDLATAYDKSTCEGLEDQYKGTRYKFVKLLKQIGFKTKKNNKRKVAKNICIKQQSNSF